MQFDYKVERIIDMKDKVCFEKFIIGRKHSRLLAAILVFAMLFAMVGCGEKEQETTTEIEVGDDDTFIDEDGFRIVKDYVVTTQDKVNVRKEAKEDGEVYITLDKGVDLTRTGIKDEWTRVIINGGNYYLLSEYVEETDIKWASETDIQKVSHVVFIDPARQITEDMSLEPMSPDVEAPALMSNGQYATPSSAQMAGMKAKMSTGAMGVSTGSFEYDVTLSIANYLNAELVKRGYTVYMSRTANNVDISNAKRAQMANAYGAEIYIKIETPNANEATATGMLGFIATSTNSHSGSRYQKNYELCYDVLKMSCEETGAKRMGIYETDELTVLNYCDMPATVMDVGFMSNEQDDIALSTDEYKKKIAMGMAKGIDLYFAESN